MNISNTDTIKQIIKSNFDKSAVVYDDFERKYNLFKGLSIALAKVCGIKEGMTVCDVGCGTGASTFTLANLIGEKGRVIGIDFSEKMLSSAKEKSSNQSNIDFKLCDAEFLKDCINIKMDAVLYNASIFLVPDTKKTLTSAIEVTKDIGIVGLNYLRGIFPSDETNENDDRIVTESSIDHGIDLFDQAKIDKIPSAPYGRKIFDADNLLNIMKEIGFKDIQKGSFKIKMNRQEVNDFYSIPAQSAGLYPKTSYEERINLIYEFLTVMESKGVLGYYQIWDWYYGVK